MLRSLLIVISLVGQSLSRWREHWKTISTGSVIVIEASLYRERLTDTAEILLISDYYTVLRFLRDAMYHDKIHLMHV